MTSCASDFLIENSVIIPALQSTLQGFYREKTYKVFIPMPSIDTCRINVSKWHYIKTTIKENQM